MSAPRWRIAAGRAVVLGLVVVVLVSLAVAPAAAAKRKGRDLSGPITAVRSAQIAAEQSMRAADIRLRTLQGAERRAERRVRKTRRRHDRSLEQRADARARAAEARRELAEAQNHLQRAAEMLEAHIVERDRLDAALAAPSAAIAILGLPAVSGRAPAIVEDRPSDRSDEDLANARLQGSVAGLEDHVALVDERVRRTERTARHVERKTRRLGRREASAIRRRQSIRAGIRGSIGQKVSAEAALSAHIYSMSRLAHLRAAKKTKGTAAPSFMWPVRGRLTQGYHPGHDGLDIAAGRGTPIRAMAQGVVAYVGWNPWDSRPRAFMVVIAHQGGYETKYGHLLPRRGIVLGELVRKGEVIGYMGNTGRSTGVHLHLEVSRGFQTISPYAML